MLMHVYDVVDELAHSYFERLHVLNTIVHMEHCLGILRLGEIELLIVSGHI